MWDQIKHHEAYNETNGQCCFNHTIGLPTKNRIIHPLYDYDLFRKGEKHVFNAMHGMKKGDFIPAFNEKMRSLIRDS